MNEVALIAASNLKKFSGKALLQKLEIHLQNTFLLKEQKSLR